MRQSRWITPLRRRLGHSSRSGGRIDSMNQRAVSAPVANDGRGHIAFDFDIFSMPPMVHSHRMA
jgi:hypothetical protein